MCRRWMVRMVHAGMGRSSNEELGHDAVERLSFCVPQYFTSFFTLCATTSATVTTVSPLAVTQNLAFGRLIAKVASVSG